MTIRANILAVQERASTDEKFATDIKNQAVEAIFEGFGSAQWNTYMANFADPATPAQLARLTTDNGDTIPYVKEAKAYLVGNAVCFPGTYGGLLQGIDHVLDQ